MMEERWEARSKLRWGSRHEGYYPSEAAARQFATKQIQENGNKGRIEAVIGNTVYYDIYPEDC